MNATDPTGTEVRDEIIVYGIKPDYNIFLEGILRDIAFGGSYGLRNEIAGFAEQLAEQIGALANEAITFYCSQQPLTPPGVSIAANIANLRQQVRDSIADNGISSPFLAPIGIPVNQAIKLGVFIDNVRTGSVNDFKNTFSNGGFESFGNFNFGAVGASLGYSGSFLLQGAGAAQLVFDFTQGNNLGEAGRIGRGLPLVRFPYGDDFADRLDIQAGINAYEAGCID